MSSRVYIGGLPERAGPRDIEDLFKKYGRVRGINVKSGFAFIEYEDGRDADDAVYDLDGKNFMGERCACSATPPLLSIFQSVFKLGLGTLSGHQTEYAMAPGERARNFVSD